ncbi:hypothetical protein RUM44_002905 [Polyplax serrata]|uniref:PROP1-like PPR domain-containing protein n=1 Tax=Polyplax serrata TaxID=468196 RepID=A0ABR1AX14_POLSC
MEIMRGKKEKILIDADKFGDTFGNLGWLEKQHTNVVEDPEDTTEYKRQKKAKGKFISEYIKEIKDCLDKHNYSKAIQILEVDMINDSKPVVPFIYKLLMSYLGKLGNLKEAYRLYTNFKERNGYVNGAMYTSLFNACANCQNSFFALEKATALREHMTNSADYVPNLSNYNCMLKAFGRHGDLMTCLQIVDEVLAKRARVKTDTYNFLIQACITDCNSGLRHALVVWRKMLQNNEKPQIHTFNLFLRCIRDCSFGDVEIMNTLIEQISRENGMVFKKKVVFTDKSGETQPTTIKIPVVSSTDKAQADQTSVSENISDNTRYLSSNLTSDTCLECIPSVEVNTSLDSKEHDIQEEQHIIDLNDKLPNLLAPRPTVGAVLNFSSMTNSSDRLLCFGGVKGFLKTMSDYNVKPCLKTFTLLLDVIERTAKAEQELIKISKDYNIDLDMAFFNALIKRRSIRHSKDEVQDALKQAQSLGLVPDIITFGVLALDCPTEESGKQLIEAARNHGIRMNNEVLHTLLRQASKSCDLSYVKTVLKAAKEDQTNLGPRFVALLSRIVQTEKHKRHSVKDIEKHMNRAIEG